MLTKKAIKKYVGSGGAACPHCGSTNINAERLEADCEVAWCSVECGDCHERWVDEYILFNIRDES